MAVKLLQGRWGNHESAWRRLRKEARLLAEVNNPYVANLIEINEQDGVPYLVMEFVEGESLARLLTRRRRLTEPEAVGVMAAVSRALADAHRRGIVHRDVKPENILLQGSRGQESGVGTEEAPSPTPSVKLCDFGLARHVLQSESLNVTEAGTAVGTPFYASPEQCTGQPIDSRTDVYAMGATLFHLLAGRPPFLADTVLGMTHLHANQPPPPLRQFNPDVSDGVIRIVEKALAKNPDARHADAEAFLLDLERLRRGEAVSVAVHPQLPAADPRRVLQYDWSWELEAPPPRLWPYVANTERLNRAAGLPAVQFTTEPDAAGGSRRFGAFRKARVMNAWREHPFEWIEGRRLGVLREYSRGVFKWLASSVELKPRGDGGTTLTHQIRIEPRSLLGRVVAALEVGAKAKRRLGRVYRRIDAYVCGKLGRPEGADPFEAPTTPTSAGLRRLDALLGRLAELRVEPSRRGRAGGVLLTRPPQEVARIRPLALADRLGLDPDETTNACLHGAREGLLLLLWDILCPLCRVPSGVKDALRAVSDHEHCPACDRDFKPDFAESVEMIFRVHPQVRSSERGVYCIGGPAHSPHVAAQVRVAPGETVEVELALYRWGVPSARAAASLGGGFRGAAGGAVAALGPAPGARRGRTAAESSSDRAAGADIDQRASGGNRGARGANRRARRRPDGRPRLDPGPVPRAVPGRGAVARPAGRPGRHDSPGDGPGSRPAGCTSEFGDARAFAVLHGYFQAVGEAVQREGGAVVKTVGEGVLASFIDPEAAVRVALELAGGAVHGAEAPLRPRVAVHRGPVLVATINDRLDYFGATVSLASRLTQRVFGGELVLTHAVASDPQVAALLHARGLPIEVIPDEAAVQPWTFLHRVKAPLLRQ